jgi:ABC-2 type transport system permease protein
MITTVMLVCLRRLLHNRIELLLAFAVPIAFFSIFALIFGSGVGGTQDPSVKVVGVDTVQDAQSELVMRALQETPGLKFVEGSSGGSDAKGKGDRGKGDTVKGDAAKGDGASDAEPRLAAMMTKSEATAMVRRGNATLAILIRRDESGEIAADLLSDASDQVSPKVVSALVQQVLGAIPGPETLQSLGPNETLGEGFGDRLTDGFAEGLSDPLGGRLAGLGVAEEMGVVQASGSEPTSSGTGATSSPIGSAGNGVSAGLTSSLANVPAKRVAIIDLLGGEKRNPVVTMYAAGIAVMFLLFGATNGGATLLEERENQTLDRLLTTGLTMDQLLLGKWGYLTMLGIAQTTLMFVWGQVVFGVDLWGHLDGFLIITVVTAGAAAAFGLMLATLCKTRGQLNGLSVVVVLTMSALGGSMVPRYVMNESLRDAGLWTFNAWALDGYDKVFWRDLPAGDLWPQMAVLMGCGAVFLITARGLAVRWEAD